MSGKALRSPWAVYLYIKTGCLGRRCGLSGLFIYTLKRGVWEGVAVPHGLFMYTLKWDVWEGVAVPHGLFIYIKTGCLGRRRDPPGLFIYTLKQGVWEGVAVSLECLFTH